MNGTVFWTLHTPLLAPCLHNPSRWPYDKMVCNFTMLNLNPSVSMLEPRATQLNSVKWGYAQFFCTMQSCKRTPAMTA